MNEYLKKFMGCYVANFGLMMLYLILFIAFAITSSYIILMLVGITLLISLFGLGGTVYYAYKIWRGL